MSHREEVVKNSLGLESSRVKARRVNSFAHLTGM
jgi:hypothetical protein